MCSDRSLIVYWPPLRIHPITGNPPIPPKSPGWNNDSIKTLRIWRLFLNRVLIHRRIVNRYMRSLNWPITRLSSKIDLFYLRSMCPWIIIKVSLRQATPTPTHGYITALFAPFIQTINPCKACWRQFSGIGEIIVQTAMHTYLVNEIFMPATNQCSDQTAYSRWRLLAILDRPPSWQKANNIYNSHLNYYFSWAIFASVTPCPAQIRFDQHKYSWIHL